MATTVLGDKNSNLAHSWFASMKRITGADWAIAYTVFARGFQIVGSTGTVLLIVRYLSPVEQGYYYTLLSLVSLQMIFELGFSFVILQFAAHEAVHLTLHSDGQIEGDPVAHCRLASVLQKTARWYLFASVSMITLLLPMGSVFFSRHARAIDAVQWHGPWAFAVAATVALFLLNPMLSFLEGCGQVRQVAGMRFAQGITAIIIPWSVLIAHHGLYAPGAVSTGYALVALVFLYSRRALLLPLLRRSAKENPVSWRREIWPFQWRLAISFLCAYFSVQVLTPALFAFRGPVEAGRMGMSLSIAGYMWALVMAWMSTKATPFGALIARQKFEELDHLFFRTLKQALSILVCMVTLCMVGVMMVQRLLPEIARRMVSPWNFVWLLLTALGVFVAQSEAIYLRAHKREPFLLQGIVVSLLTMAGVFLIVPRWGINGATLIYFICTGIVGSLLATAILQQSRNARRLAFDDGPPCS
jgi:O-antigen/teichoic acid export membrane protein